MGRKWWLRKRWRKGHAFHFSIEPPPCASNQAPIVYSDRSSATCSHRSTIDHKIRLSHLESFLISYSNSVVERYSITAGVYSFLFSTHLASHKTVIIIMYRYFFAGLKRERTFWGPSTPELDGPRWEQLSIWISPSLLIFLYLFMSMTSVLVPTSILDSYTDVGKKNYFTLHQVFRRFQSHQVGSNSRWPMS